MKKELFIKIGLLLILLSSITLLHRLFSLSYWQLWVGGLIGVFLLDLDQLLYVFVLKPLDFVSQRVVFAIKNRNFKEAAGVLYETKNERGELLFHSFGFVIIFAVLTFWVSSSSGSYFGKGLVLGAWLHLCTYYYKKYKADNSIELPILVGMIALLLISAILL